MVEVLEETIIILSKYRVVVRGSCYYHIAMVVNEKAQAALYMRPLLVFVAFIGHERRAQSAAMCLVVWKLDSNKRFLIKLLVPKDDGLSD